MRKVRWPERKKIFDLIIQYRNQNLGSIEIANQLNSQNLFTKTGMPWNRQKVDTFIYVCKKAGMRQRQSYKTDQLPLVSIQPKSQYKITAPESVSFESALTSDIDGEKLTIMKTIIESKLPANKKFEAIVAVLK